MHIAIAHKSRRNSELARSPKRGLGDEPNLLGDRRASNLQYTKSVDFMTLQYFSIIFPIMLHLCSFQSPNFQYFSVYLPLKISTSTEESVRLEAL